MVIILVGALIIGLTLGLLGSGGSAITVPVLVYLVGHHAKQSIAESMAIVGLISLAAAIPYARAKQIDWRSVWFFGIPGMVGTFLGAWLGGLATEAIQLVVFGGVLLVAAYAMLRGPKPNLTVGLSADRAPDSSEQDRPPHSSPIWKVALEGTVVGVVTGFVGVGGGFLIVPALVILGRLPMRLAIGTSLVIIAFKAAIGFAKYQQYLVDHQMSVDVPTILLFVLVGIVGSLIGKSLNAHMNQHLLKRVFAVALIVLGGFVIINEGSKLVWRPTDLPVAEASKLDVTEDTNRLSLTTHSSWR
jgi:uncharacterized membrane protein YfcA